MANNDWILTENIADTIRPGLRIYDAESEKVGVVVNIDLATGWFTGRTEPLPERTLYIPFSLVTNIDPRDLFVSRSKDELLASYTAPRPRTITATEVDGSETAITTEPSGYDGGPIVVEWADIDRLKTQIAAGQRVCTSDTRDLGTIKRYDSATGWMLIEKGILSDKHDTMVPITLVDRVDPATGQVYLAVRKSDLQRMQHLEPAEIVFSQARMMDSNRRSPPSGKPSV